MLLTLIFLMFGHVGWAMGIVPGLDGFARKSDLVQQEQKIESMLGTQEEILRRIVAQSIEDARQRQCHLLAEQQPGAAEGWAQTLLTNLEEYRVMTGREYSLRPCTEY